VLLRLAASILSIGVVACVLLTTRQLRLQAVHELAQVQKRVAEHDRTLWRLRIEIARRVTPANVERLAARRAGLSPLPPVPVVPGSTAPEPARLTRADEAHGAPGGER